VCSETRVDDWELDSGMCRVWHREQGNGTVMDCWRRLFEKLICKDICNHHCHLCDIHYKSVWFSVSSWYTLSGVLSFLLSLDFMFETKLYMSLLCAGSRETISRSSCHILSNQTLFSLDWTQQTSYSGVFVPQGFVRTSHIWHVLGHNWNYPLAFSAVHCDLTA
jgi:hypothetical protein